MKIFIVNSLFVLLIGDPFPHGNAGKEENDKSCEYRRGYRNPFDAFDYVEGNNENPPPQNNFTEIVGMPRDFPKSCN